MVVGKFAAALLLLIGVCFFGSTMVARANLDVLFKKIEVALEDSSMYVYDEKTDSYIFNMYEPGYVPEGYEEVLRVVDDRVVTISYENKEKKFEYRSGAIENDNPIFTKDGNIESGILNSKGIQQHICDILEGGETAFEKRKNKYRI